MVKVTDRVKTMRRIDWIRITGLVGVVVLLVTIALNVPRTPAHAAPSDWSMFQNGLERTGYNGNETTINPSTAPNLKVHWSNQAPGSVSSQPVVVNNTIYWGSWDGLEHATDVTTGTDTWTQQIGQTAGCTPKHPRGVISTATISSLQIKGVTKSVVIVAGGNAQLYALDAASGTIIWQTKLGSSPDHFVYSSPAVYNGNVYIGVSSYDDCPEVQGKVVQLNAVNGQILHVFYTVPTGCSGGGVWGSSAVNASTGILYIATGDLGHCTQAEPYVSAVLAFNTVDLSLVASWQVQNLTLQQNFDFGTTPMLFDATIGGTLHHMLGIGNKRGIYYALDQSNISAGPLWKLRYAQPGGDPTRDSGSISSSAWDGKHIYIAGSAATVNGVTCAGSMRAVTPATGAILWQVCLNSTVLGAITSVPGLVIFGSGDSMYVLDAQTGKTLYTYQDMTVGTGFWGAASISNGVIYDGNQDGNLYAFGL